MRLPQSRGRLGLSPLPQCKDGVAGQGGPGAPPPPQRQLLLSDSVTAAQTFWQSQAEQKRRGLPAHLSALSRAAKKFALFLRQGLQSWSPSASVRGLPLPHHPLPINPRTNVKESGGGAPLECCSPNSA